MKKIKISELPLYSTLKGLFTIGTDANNNSVKVSLEFVEQETTKAVNNANAATVAANNAASAATTAKNNAVTATNNAVDATNKAKTATTNAETATTNAVTATKNADDATTKSNAATEKAKTATTNADNATQAAREATQEAEEATAAANNATSQILAAFGGLVPFTMEVECMERITLGNLLPKAINVTLTPAGTLKNVIYISDNKAVTVAPDGRIQVIAKGRSTVHVIPTLNTALAKTVQIEVTEPTLRMVNTRKQLRFTQSGALRLN